jgi:hypothetical protein
MLTAVTITGPVPALVGALSELRDHAASARFPLGLPDAPGAMRIRAELVGQFDDYLLPRLRRPDAPLLVVVGGSTGAGKSTLVNSLVRQQVTKAGVLRPTTRTPVLVAHPDDVALLTGPERMLPRLVRTAAVSGRPDTIVLASSPALPRGVALIDAPDLNSVVEANREQAERLLAAADAWLMVTTAERYADAVPWRLLSMARDRRTPLAVVLDRVPQDTLPAVRDACGALLAVNGLGKVPLFVLPETVLTGGLLPEYLLDPLLDWLRTPAYDLMAREALLVRNLGGLLDSLRGRVATLADAVMSQAKAADELRTNADQAYVVERAAVYDAVDGGELLRGELLARWQEFLGRPQDVALLSGAPRAKAKGAAARGGVGDAGRSRGRAGTLTTDTLSELRATLVTVVAAAVSGALRRADEQAASSWRKLPGGDDALNRGWLSADGQQAADEYGSPAPWARNRRRGTDEQPPAGAAATVSDWLAGLPELISRQLRDVVEPPPRAIPAGAVGPAVLLAVAVLAGIPQPSAVSALATTSATTSALTSASASTAASATMLVQAPASTATPRSAAVAVRAVTRHAAAEPPRHPDEEIRDLAALPAARHAGGSGDRVAPGVMSADTDAPTAAPPASIASASGRTEARSGSDSGSTAGTTAGSQLAAAQAARELADAVFGASNAARLIQLARTELDVALGVLFDQVAARHRVRIAELGIDSGLASLLRDAQQNVQRVR